MRINFKVETGNSFYRVEFDSGPSMMVTKVEVADGAKFNTVAMGRSFRGDVLTASEGEPLLLTRKGEQVLRTSLVKRITAIAMFAT